VKHSFSDDHVQQKVFEFCPDHCHDTLPCYGLELQFAGFPLDFHFGHLLMDNSDNVDLYGKWQAEFSSFSLYHRCAYTGESAGRN